MVGIGILFYRTMSVQCEFVRQLNYTFTKEGIWIYGYRFDVNNFCYCLALVQYWPVQCLKLSQTIPINVVQTKRQCEFYTHSMYACNYIRIESVKFVVGTTTTNTNKLKRTKTNKPTEHWTHNKRKRWIRAELKKKKRKEKRINIDCS